MSTNTGIEWTDATWNPIRGCSRVSEGCRNCYAEQVAARFSGEGQAYYGLARRRSNGEAQWTGVVHVAENHMLDPLSWRAPRRVFVNSMSDLFHENVTDETIDRVFAVMALASHHTFQILTKRPARMLAYMTELFQADRFQQAGVSYGRGTRVSRAIESIVYNGEGLSRFGGARWWTEDGKLRAMHAAWPLPNVWLGVSTENQETADERIPLLLATPAAVRFLSCEPLLGPIDLKNCGTTPYFTDRGCLPDGRGTSIDWVIVGGESGHGARPCDVEWIVDIVAQCDFAGVPCFVKQLGRHPVKRENGQVTWPEFDLRNRKGGDMAEWPEELRVRQFPRALTTVEKE